MGAVLMRRVASYPCRGIPREHHLRELRVCALPCHLGRRPPRRRQRLRPRRCCLLRLVHLRSPNLPAPRATTLADLPIGDPRRHLFCPRTIPVAVSCELLFSFHL